MTIENEENMKEKPLKQSRKKSVLLRILLYFFIFLIIISTSIIILSQFSSFRKAALKQILGIVNNELIAQIEVDDLTFFSLEGIKFKGVRLLTDGDTLANIPELVFDLDYEPLFDNKIRLNRLILRNPVIKLLRNSKDSLWNYDKIAIASEDTNSNGNTNWEIIAKKIEFKNASFLRYDSTITYINHLMMDYDHISLQNFDLILSASVSLKNNDLSAQIYKLVGVEYYSNLRIQNLSTKLKVNSSEISAKDFAATLNESEFDINVEMKNYDVFDTINQPDISEAVFKVAAKGFNIQDSIIQKFASIPITFGNSSDIMIDANGTLNDLNIDRLKLITGKSDINISGKLKELLNIDKFEYEFSLDKSKVTRKDIIQVLSNLDLTALPDFGNADFRRLYVKGFLDSVYTDTEFDSDLGYVKGKAGINYKTTLTRYFGMLDIRKFNPALITKNIMLKGNLNGKFDFKGEGTSLEDLNIKMVTDLDHSQFYGTDITKFITGISVNRGIIQIDSLRLTINKNKIQDKDKYLLLDENYSKVELNGDIDINNIQQPKFNLVCKVQYIDLSDILDNPSMPDYFSGKFDINLKGLSLDSLEGDFSASIDELSFSDRAFFPFKFDADFKRISPVEKNISINSDFLEFNLNGDFSLESIIGELTLQGTLLSEYIKNRLEYFNPKRMLNPESFHSENEITKIFRFPNLNARLSTHISDLSPLNIFLDSMSIYSDISINARVESSDTMSSFIIDSLDLKYFNFKTNDIEISTSKLGISSSLRTEIKDSIPSIKQLDIKLDKVSGIIINGTNYDSLYSTINYNGKLLDYNVGTFINSSLGLSSKGKINIGDSTISLISEYSKVIYKKDFIWETKEPIKISTTPTGFFVDDLTLYRNKGETIHLKGSVDNDIAKDLELEITNLSASDYIPLAGESLRKSLAGMNFHLDSLRIRANGNIKTPRIVSSIYADSLVFSNYKIGTLSGRLIHNQTYMHGFFDITTPVLSNKKTLILDVNYLPLYLGTDSEKPFFDETKSMDIRLKAMSMPLELIAPFAVGLSELKGFADANIVVEGSIKDGVTYSGSATSSNARIKIENTNIQYNADLKIDFNKDKVTLTKVLLKNIPEDARFGRLGKAEVSGTIGLNGFEIGYLDIYINSDRLLAMSDATMVTMPDMYGDFIISTGDKTIRFYGTLDKPNLDGDIDINYGHLKMPMEQKKQIVRTYLTYQVIGDKVRVQSTTQKDTVVKENENVVQLAPNIADLINYNLNLKILGQFIVEMDMNLIGSMYAVISTPDRLQTLRYEKKRDWNEGKLFGEVVVKDQSTIKSWKQFTTGGKINFPTGSIENPSLDLSATHIGTMNDNGSRKQFIVKMYISGFKENPKVKFIYFVDGVEGSGSQEQINEDALYLLVTGRTKSGNGGTLNASLLNEGFASGVSNFATKALSELLMGTGVIQSAEFDFQGGSMNFGDATLRLSGQLYGGIIWTVGGTVADLSSNNQITIDIPASEFLSNPFWSNFVVQLSKASNNNVLANTQDAKNWELKVKLGSSW